MSQTPAGPPIPSPHPGQSSYSPSSYAPPTAQPAYGAPQYGTPQYGTPQYGTGRYGALRKAQPLEARQKRGAMIAGAVSFCGLSLGWAMVAIVLIMLLVFGLFSAILTSFNRPDETNYVANTVRGMWEAGWPWMIAVGVVGLAIMVVSFLAGRWILRAHEVHRPTAVQWSAFGIAVVATNVLGGGLGSGLGGLIEPLSDANFLTSEGEATIYIIGALLAVGFTAAVGMFSWWWMAHAYRPLVFVNAPAPSGAVPPMMQTPQHWPLPPTQ